jgi:choline dehydrogenase
LSGVGDPEHLGKIGVPVAHESRGVGKNMQDHYAARVSYPVVGAQIANERSRGLPLAGEVMRWLITGKGMLTYSPSIVAASVKVLEESAAPDMQCTFAPGSFKGGQISELEDEPGLSAGAWQMRPLSRGYVEAKSNRPGDMPAINPRYLSEEADRRAIIGGLRFARLMFAAPALKQFVREESLPAAMSRPTTNCGCPGSTGCGSSTPRSCRRSPRPTRTRRPEGCRDDQRRRAAKSGGVAQRGGGAPSNLYHG